MRELRAVVAVGLGVGGWLALNGVGNAFEPGRWYLAVVVGFALFGPAIAGTLSALPGLRGADITLGGIAASVVPPLFFLFVVNPPDSGWELWLGVLFLGVLALAGGMIAWGTGVIVGEFQRQSTPGTSSGGRGD